jgi:hypothetical protein
LTWPPSKKALWIEVLHLLHLERSHIIKKPKILVKEAIIGTPEEHVSAVLALFHLMWAT